MTVEQAKELRKAGVTRYHSNLETAGSNFPNICSTHTYADKFVTIKNAQAAGLRVCSGGILGLGETREQRVEWAFTLKELGIDSVPLNMLTPIPGTPFENNKPLRRWKFCVRSLFSVLFCRRHNPYGRRSRSKSA